MSFFALSEALAQAPIKTTFVSGSGRGGQEGPAMICDDQLSTKWCIDFPRLMPYSIVLDAGQQTGVVEYGLVTGDDTNAVRTATAIRQTEVTNIMKNQAGTGMSPRGRNRMLSSSADVDSCISTCSSISLLP